MSSFCALIRPGWRRSHRWGRLLILVTTPLSVSVLAGSRWLLIFKLCTLLLKRSSSCSLRRHLFILASLFLWNERILSFLSIRLILVGDLYLLLILGCLPFRVSLFNFLLFLHLLLHDLLLLLFNLPLSFFVSFLLIEKGVIHLFCQIEIHIVVFDESSDGLSAIIDFT